MTPADIEEIKALLTRIVVALERQPPRSPTQIK